jgi:uncharacterized protein YegL
MRIKNPMIEKPVIPMRYDFARAGKNGTLIAVIMDESGSMSPVQNQTIAAFNEFVLGQKNTGKETGAAYMTLVKFDAPAIHTVFSNRPIAEVPDLNTETYSPRGGTNLLDAVGHAMAKVQNELSRHDKIEDRPGVIVLIMTDGEENSSEQYNRDEIKKMVKSAEESDWTFTFLGANIDAFAASAKLGMGNHNTLQYNVNNMGGTMWAASEMVTATRSAKMKGVDTQSLYASGLYSDDQRNKAK